MFPIGSSTGGSKTAIVQRVRQILQSSKAWQKSWNQYCNVEGHGDKDPENHTPDFLKIFLEEYENSNGQATAVWDDSDSEDMELLRPSSKPQASWVREPVAAATSTTQSGPRLEATASMRRFMSAQAQARREGYGNKNAASACRGAGIASDPDQKQASSPPALSEPPAPPRVASTEQMAISPELMQQYQMLELQRVPYCHWPGHAALVERLRCLFQENGLLAKNVWNKACLEQGNGISDPVLQHPSFLLGALQQISARAARAEPLVREVKRIQRGNNALQTRWRRHCEKFRNATGFMELDPKKFDIWFLQEFIDSVEKKVEHQTATNPPAQDSSHLIRAQQIDDELVERVNAVLQASPVATGYWHDLCSCEGAGETDPKLQARTLLESFLKAMNEAGIEAPTRELLLKVRTALLLSVKKKVWQQMCDLEDPPGIYEPSKHEATFLESFLEAIGRFQKTVIHPLLAQTNSLDQAIPKSKKARIDGQDFPEAKRRPSAPEKLESSTCLMPLPPLTAAAFTSSGASTSPGDSIVKKVSGVLAPQTSPSYARFLVQGLPSRAVDADLEEHFAVYGDILEASVVNRSTGSFAYVTVKPVGDIPAGATFKQGSDALLDVEDLTSQVLADEHEICDQRVRVVKAPSDQPEEVEVLLMSQSAKSKAAPGRLRGTVSGN